MSASAFPKARLVRWAATLAIGALAGYACAWLRTPIPWMIGPLFSIALLRVAGAPLEVPLPVRYAGQWIIGTSLGLYFTPHVIHEVGGLWWLLVAGAIFAIALGYVSGLALARMASLDKTTGIFASVPGGAAEMSIERFGGRVDRIAAAQSLRILIVVAIVPPVITALGVHGSDIYTPGATVFVGSGFAILMAATLAGGFVFQALRVPNGFVLGALAVAIPMTAAEINLSSLPTPVSNLGQLMIGAALGSRFHPEFLRGAHRFVGAVFGTVLLSIVLSALFGVGLAWASGQHPATMVLGNAPGGIAEMCITAKVLRISVAFVTAAHVIRYVIVVLLTRPVYRLFLHE